MLPEPSEKELGGSRANVNAVEDEDHSDLRFLPSVDCAERDSSQPPPRTGGTRSKGTSGVLLKAWNRKRINGEAKGGPVVNKKEASSGFRPRDLLITNQVLYQLS
jgi:hypothetical protein